MRLGAQTAVCRGGDRCSLAGEEYSTGVLAMQNPEDRVFGTRFRLLFVLLVEDASGLWCSSVVQRWNYSSVWPADAEPGSGMVWGGVVGIGHLAHQRQVERRERFTQQPGDIALVEAIAAGGDTSAAIRCVLSWVLPGMIAMMTMLSAEAASIIALSSRHVKHK